MTGYFECRTLGELKDVVDNLIDQLGSGVKLGTQDRGESYEAVVTFVQSTDGVDVDVCIE